MQPIAGYDAYKVAAPRATTAKARKRAAAAAQPPVLSVNIEGTDASACAPVCSASDLFSPCKPLRLSHRTHCARVTAVFYDSTRKLVLLQQRAPVVAVRPRHSFRLRLHKRYPTQRRPSPCGKPGR
eukprot:SAG11_NODE_1247_length_5401_cov_2.372878_10_plen_126_part_00